MSTEQQQATEIKEVERRKCTRCKVHLPLDHFKQKRCGNYTKRCKVCNEKTRKKTTSKNYECETCGKAFIQKNNLFIHIRTHTGEKPYTCDTCGKAFSQSTHLNAHIRTHTGEKPYKCKTCGEAFSQSSELDLHIRTHTGEKPYTCEICDRTFRVSTHLTKHKRTHTGEKPYSCDVCDKAFSDSSTLINHKRTHTGEKPYSCDICGKSFTQSTQLTRHALTCGDTMSRPERMCADALELLEIKYIPQHTFHDCRNILPLPFDFYLPDLKALIEYDGIYHYKPIRGNERLERQQRNDKIKTDYCAANNIPLLRIPYTQKDNITDLIYKFVEELSE